MQDEKVGVVGLGGEPEASCASHPKMVEFSSSLFSGGHSSSAVKTKDGSGIELGSWCSNEGMSKLTRGKYRKFDHHGRKTRRLVALQLEY